MAGSMVGQHESHSAHPAEVAAEANKWHISMRDDLNEEGANHPSGSVIRARPQMAGHSSH